MDFSVDSIINELIRMDRKAKEAVAGAEARRDDQKAKIAKAKDEIYKASENEADGLIEKARKEALTRLDDELELINQKFLTAEKELDSLYIAKKDEWIRDIYAAIVF